MWDSVSCVAEGLDDLSKREQKAIRSKAIGHRDDSYNEKTADDPSHRHDKASDMAEGMLPHIKPGIPAVFVYDGTLEGLMTTVYLAFSTHTIPEDVLEAHRLQPRLWQQIITVETDFQAAMRVRRSICNTCGEAVWHAVAMASAADDPQAATAILRFVTYALSQNKQGGCSACPKKNHCTVPCSHPKGSGVLADWANPVVEPVLALQRRVANEAEKMKQFVRFQHTEDGLWYARCNPNAAVVPLIMAHFAARFNTQRFIIYDETHRMAGISQGGQWELIRIDNVAVPPPAPDEAKIQDAWKRFYNSLSIEARYNPELRRHFMPVRLWRNLTEMQQENTEGKSA